MFSVLAKPAKYRIIRISASFCSILVMVGGCSFSTDKELATVSNMANYAKSYDHAVGPERNLLEKTLEDCSEKTVKAESLCVKQAVENTHLSLASFAAKFPNCSIGKSCHYDYTTHDNLGFVEATAASFVVRWRVEADFGNNVKNVADVPLKVTNRDDFGDPTKDAAKKLEKPVPLVQVLPEKP